ncbi:hypothetical protein DGG96_14490 [Legionella qingyii]|uniref:Uncharacterized protein n=1 Tax=Legionella qingyii TaxID=2184757 RepID=A0A317U299_9GAMM|nr:hypothetical protein DGG96_14490 [Legionella qingyii]
MSGRQIVVASRQARKVVGSVEVSSANYFVIGLNVLLVKLLEEIVNEDYFVKKERTSTGVNLNLEPSLNVGEENGPT